MGLRGGAQSCVLDSLWEITPTGYLTPQTETERCGQAWGKDCKGTGTWKEHKD